MREGGCRSIGLKRGRSFDTERTRRETQSSGIGGVPAGVGKKAGEIRLSVGYSNQTGKKVAYIWNGRKGAKMEETTQRTRPPKCWLVRHARRENRGDRKRNVGRISPNERHWSVGFCWEERESSAEYEIEYIYIYKAPLESGFVMDHPFNNFFLFASSILKYNTIPLSSTRAPKKSLSRVFRSLLSLQRHQ